VMVCDRAKKNSVAQFQERVALLETAVLALVVDETTKALEQRSAALNVLRKVMS